MSRAVLYGLFDVWIKPDRLNHSNYSNVLFHNVHSILDVARMILKGLVKPGIPAYYVSAPFSRQMKWLPVKDLLYLRGP